MNIMKRKTNNLARAAMMLLFAVLGSVGAWASDVVTVGTAQWDLAYVPIDLSWNYSASQQIYTKSEVGAAKQITSIAFNTIDGGYNSGYKNTKKISSEQKKTGKIRKILVFRSKT